MEKWDRRFIELAKHVSTWSKDPSTKVGAVIVDDAHRVVGLGYNGFPRGINDTPERYADREIKYQMVVHAEANAILNAIIPVDGCTLYCTFFPCPECAKLIIQAGIKTVVAIINPADERWLKPRLSAESMLREANVGVHVFNNA